jgi:hypothetical protein
MNTPFPGLPAEGAGNGVLVFLVLPRRYPSRQVIGIVLRVSGPVRVTLMKLPTTVQVGVPGESALGGWSGSTHRTRGGKEMFITMRLATLVRAGLTVVALAVVVFLALSSPRPVTPGPPPQQPVPTQKAGALPGVPGGTRVNP